MRICAPSRASSCGEARCQKSSQTQIPEAQPEPAVGRPQRAPGREEAPLVEEPVRRQEDLAMDVAHAALLEQRRRDEEPMVLRFLDERDDDAHPRLAARASSTRRASSRRIATSALRSWSR